MKCDVIICVQHLLVLAVVTVSNSTMPRLQRDWNLSSSFSTNATPPRHAGRKISSRSTQHDHHPAGHVLAAVIARAFDDRLARRCFAPQTARPPCRSNTLRPASRRRATCCRPGSSLPAYKARCLRRIHDDLPARQSLAEIVVRLALEDQRDAPRQKRAERSVRPTRELDRDRVRRAIPPVRTACDLDWTASCRPCGSYF